jgi:hypothetical protein
LATFEVRLQKPARDFLRRLPPDQPDQLDRVGILLDRLEDDPHVDGVTKITQLLPPVSLSLLNDGEFWILYHIVRGNTVSVLNIDYAEEPVTPRRK